jgi:hypothetical protein
MMIPIHKFAGQDLLWTPSAALKHQYELLAGETVLATLDMSSWTSAAQAVTADGSFIIKREGFFRQQVMIRGQSSLPTHAVGGVVHCSLPMVTSLNGKMQISGARKRHGRPLPIPVSYIFRIAPGHVIS